MKLYIYEVETNEVISIVEGETNKDCEEQVEFRFDWDICGSAYTTNGLHFFPDDYYDDNEGNRH